MEKSYTWGHSIIISVIYSWRVWMPTNLRLENQLDSTQNSSYFSLSFRHWDCTANGWELIGLNLQFNIQSRLAIFSKWSTIHITGFLGKVFESAAVDKCPEVTRWMTRRITWSWHDLGMLSHSKKHFTDTRKYFVRSARNWLTNPITCSVLFWYWVLVTGILLGIGVLVAE